MIKIEYAVILIFMIFLYACSKKMEFYAVNPIKIYEDERGCHLTKIEQLEPIEIISPGEKFIVYDNYYEKDCWCLKIMTSKNKGYTVWNGKDMKNMKKF